MGEYAPRAAVPALVIVVIHKHLGRGMEYGSRSARLGGGVVQGCTGEGCRGEGCRGEGCRGRVRRSTIACSGSAMPHPWS